jgi:hypothetical protein
MKRVRAYSGQLIHELEVKKGELIGFDSHNPRKRDIFYLGVIHNFVYNSSASGFTLHYQAREDLPDEYWKLRCNGDLLRLHTPSENLEPRVVRRSKTTVYSPNNIVVGKEEIVRELRARQGLELYADWIENGKLIEPGKMGNILSFRKSTRLPRFAI